MAFGVDDVEIRELPYFTAVAEGLHLGRTDGRPSGAGRAGRR